jgi:hypothetical protein
LSGFAPYIDYPAQRHKDTTWDLYVCTLSYHGQLVDLTGDKEAFIYNKDSGNWDPLEMNFNEVVWVNVFGHTLPVQNPIDLIGYKLKIKYDEDKHLDDVEAVRRYIHNQH